jgi:PAS domain S-box-containing protein
MNTVRTNGSKWFSPSFGVKINFILGLGLAIMVAVGSLASRSIESLVEAGGFELETFSEISSLESVIGALRRAESASRKYVITGDPADLKRYRDARARVNFTSIGPDASGSDDTQRRRLAQLQRAVNERLRLLDAVVQMRGEPGGDVAAAQRVRSGVGEEASIRVQTLADEFRDYELRTLRNRRVETAFNARNADFVMFWGLSFAMTLLLWAMVVIHRHQAARRLAEDALRASESQLRLITDAMPALIGYIDRNDRLLFHNRAFEAWFDRSAGELRERTLRSLLGAEAYARVVPRITEVLEGREVAFELLLPGVRGTDMYLSVQLVPRLDVMNAVIGYYALATDISALKELDRLKSEFVATVSHELRTPLTSIRGSLGLLAAGVTGALPDKARELVKIALQNCERLVRLVNDILDSEKMLSGKMDWVMRELDLVELIRRSIKENESYAASHGVSVRMESSEPSIAVLADSDRLVQVVTNLLSNACKFSPPGGVVEVTVQFLGECKRVRVSVADRGAGVPRELQGRLFERFAQLDSNDVRRKGGSGLGLSICRSIIEHLGGVIGFSEREGGGSIFFFELPALADGTHEDGTHKADAATKQVDRS